MAVTGSLDVNLTPYSQMTNNAALFGEGITKGITAQSDVIGQVLGIVMAVGALVLLIGVVFGVVWFVLAKGKSATSRIKGVN
jgi:hypothetical protein